MDSTLPLLVLALGVLTTMQVTDILRGNNIHDLWYGPYLSGVGNMIIEKNQSHHNLNYGFDPHTGSHDIIIRNNLAHDNGQEGIICSVNCSNILFDNNRTYHNEKSGIMLSRNTYRLYCQK